MLQLRILRQDRIPKSNVRSSICIRSPFRTGQPPQEKRDERWPLMKVVRFSTAHMLYFPEPLHLIVPSFFLPESHRKQFRVMLPCFIHGVHLSNYMTAVQ